MPEEVWSCLSGPLCSKSFCRSPRLWALFEHLVDAARASYSAALARSRQQDLIRAPQVYCIEHYINPESINRLKRELGLT